MLSCADLSLIYLPSRTEWYKQKCLFFLFLFSVNSTSSGSSTKFDPDLLKADVALAKNRVARLRRDLDVARAEFAYQQRGIDMLSQ